MHHFNETYVSYILSSFDGIALLCSGTDTLNLRVYSCMMYLTTVLQHLKTI